MTSRWTTLLVLVILFVQYTTAFLVVPTTLMKRVDFKNDNRSVLYEMKRPILDQIASTLFKLENDRVEASSVFDEKGRIGEPMEWSESNSIANKFSEIFAKNPIGYQFKQWVADIIAGEYDVEAVNTTIDDFININQIAIFSFTTCPFCRRVKDTLDELGIVYASMELDTLDGNTGNEIRACLGRKTKRTSVPSIFINTQYIGGCNDGNPGLLPLIGSGEFNKLLSSSSTTSTTTTTI